MNTMLASIRRQGRTIPQSRYGVRFPVQLYRSGVAYKADLDGGTLGYTSQGAYSSIRAAYYNVAFGIGYTHEQQKTAKTNVAAAQKLTEQIVSEGLEMIEGTSLVYMFGDGTGRLTSSSSAYSSGTYTFKGASDRYGVYRVEPGTVVDVWDSGLTTKRAGGPYIVVQQDPTAATAKLVGLTSGATTVTAGASGDVLTVVALDVYGPAGPTTGNSTYPGTLPFAGAGVSGDSFIHGLDYVMDDNTSSYYCGVQRSTSVQGLVPVSVDAAGALTFTHMAELRVRSTIKIGGEYSKGWRGFMNPANAVNLQALIQRTQLVMNGPGPGGKAYMYDNVPEAGYDEGSTIMMDTVPVTSTRLCRRDHVQCFRPEDIAMVGEDFTPFPNAAGGTTHIQRASTGFMKTAFEIQLTAAMEYVHPAPGQCGFVKGITLPSYA
jgi:hypothetical protein